MKPHSLVSVLGIACFLLLAAASVAFQSNPGYHLLRIIPLDAAPGGGEYFDYINFNAASRRVYLSRGTEFTVLDGDTDAVIGNVTGLKRDHGVALAPELNRGFITDGDAGEVVIFDLKTLRETGRIKTDHDSDSILYDSVSKHVFAFNGDPHTVTVIDPAAGKAVATLALGGAPEQAVADGRGMIYDNLEDKNEVVAIDTRALKITARWPVAPAGQPVSIAMDRQSRRLFIGARNPAVFIVMNADTGKVIGSSFPIGARVDTSIFDPETKLAACSTGDGTIHIFHEDSSDAVSLVQTVKTQYGAKTMALDPKTHNLLVDTADFEVPAGGAANARPVPKPGTLRLLIYGR
jgi:DNA-binding beta-propeller fold protein YncE